MLRHGKVGKMQVQIFNCPLDLFIAWGEKKRNNAERVLAGALVYQAAVIEYLAAEVLELAAEVLELADSTVRNNKKTLIIPRHL